MLTHVDVFLGVAMVMLAVSLILTIFTQIVSFVLGLRGSALRNGLADLFKNLKLAAPTELANKVLSHPLIYDGIRASRVAQAISRSDLLHLFDNAERYLGVSPDVQASLNKMRGEIDVWFDGTMSRIANRFSVHTRIVTVIGAVIAAFALHLDAFALVTKLYGDSDLRARMAAASDGLLTQGQQILASPTQAGPSMDRWVAQVDSLKADLGQMKFTLVPDPYRPFSFSSVWAFLGVLTSAGLLSLGAPFWFNTLKTVSNLRPAIAAQVDAREAAARRAGPADDE